MQLSQFGLPPPVFVCVFLCRYVCVCVCMHLSVNAYMCMPVCVCVCVSCFVHACVLTSLINAVPPLRCYVSGVTG